MIRTVIESSRQADQMPKWFSSPITSHRGTLNEIAAFIPTFERQDFALIQPENTRSRFNGHLDTIVRMPFADDPDYVPVGTVSKEYALVQHTEVFDVAVDAFNKAKIDISKVKAEIEITEYGERMALTLYLPEAYNFDPGDGYPLNLRIECFNSVDGSTRFRVLMGWFRFVCSNGLIIGVTYSDVRRRHIAGLGLGDVNTVLKAGIEESQKEKNNLELWIKKPIKLTNLKTWIDKDLKDLWGFKAATRAYHIARCGYDMEIVGPYKDKSPTTIKVRTTKPVPGAPPQCRSLYDVSQILAWIAKERRDVQEQLQWREQISGLLKPLMN